jgi:poly(3-hydroxyalkanoate) synthetase
MAETMLAPEPHNRPEQRQQGNASGAAGAPNLLLWPLIAAATASDALASYFGDLARAAVDVHCARARPEPSWTTPHRIALDLATARLRDFSTSLEGTPTLICAPYALHGATIADFAPGHSLVETLHASGLHRVYVTEWRSAGPDMRYLSVDNYLADLNVMVDALGAPVDLVGLCQGGWMALVYAARFPGKVRRLVLAGAPIDVRAGPSILSEMTAGMPLSSFAEIVRLGEGRVIGSRLLDVWGPALAAEERARVLQLAAGIESAQASELDRHFSEWYGWTLDLPGTYYLQVVSWLFKQNRIARGCFPALGRVVDLAAVDIPVFLIAARDDALETITEPCGHLSLFIGRETLHRAWGRAARWLKREITAGHTP